MRNRRFPKYPDDADYTTNSPSYYDDLARKQKLIQLLAEKIWEYEETLDLTLDQITTRLESYIQENDTLMNERLEQWDLNLEKFPENVELLLQEWLQDGTLDHIINVTIFNGKADKTFVDSEIERLEQTDENLNNMKADLTYVDSEIEQVNNKIDHFNIVSVIDYGAKGDGVTDDTVAIQTAIDENEQIFFPKGQYKLSESLIIRDGKNTQLIGVGTETLTREQADTTEFLINGFTGIEVPPHDNPIEQVKIGLKNITIRGTGKEIGLNGDWGGTIENCLFSNLLVGTKTTMGWGCNYHRTVYHYCDTGLISEQTYNTQIVKCHFSHYRIGMDTGKNSVSLLIQQNIINLDDETEVGMIVKDGVTINTNYVENFGETNPETYAIDYSFSRFANPTLNMQSNYFRGHKETITHVKISDYIGHQYLSEIVGTIKNNQFTRTSESPIKYEEGRLFHGIEVENNQSEHPIDTPLVPFRPYYQSTLGLNLNLNNNEFEDIPAPYLTYYNGNNLGEDNQFIAPISGLYEITYSVTLGSILVDEMEDNTVGIYTAGEMVHESRVTVKTGKTPEGDNETNVVTVTGTLLKKLNRSNKVTVRGKGQSRVRRGYLTVKCLDNFSNKHFADRL